MHRWELDLKFVPKERWWFRLLSKDPGSGATTVVMRMEEGFLIPTAGHYNVTQELLVLDGEIAVGDRRLAKGAYSYRPAGVVEGPVAAARDSTVFCRYGGTVQRLDAALGDIDKPMSV